ncbi:MAG: class I SAM-dependent methyltransferase [Actinobacteria bacterium]|nr:class I SAM-dependent methyltransferase [Actinomycetota bacterium]MCZ6739965.1 class I SAM-dependent methyltransferase [Actinomycetota bacterium]
MVDGGTDPIASFYERHPYPPPVKNLDAYQRRWNDPTLSQVEHHLMFPNRQFRAHLDVLVAGSGTFQAARHAMRWPEGKVVGIDVSQTSIRHTEELKRQHALANLELRRLRIEEIVELDREFDLIVCTGVLHHLADPERGLRALRSVLRPGGAMLVMVYAPYGRTGVTMMQEYVRLLGIESSEQEIQDLALSLKEIPRDHPLDSLLPNSPDFRRTDAMADALLNPRDRTYSVPQLFEYVEKCGLTFGRWYRQAPYLPQCGAISSTPHAALLAALPPAEQYAAMELFRGTMSRHSIVIHRSDDPVEMTQHGLSPADWATAVPILLPDTISVGERLPPGAASVLINRSHIYPDLILPISADEKRFVDEIDGHRTVGEIAEAVGVGDIGTLMDRLVSYDQVVITTSTSDGSSAV